MDFWLVIWAALLVCPFILSLVFVCKKKRVPSICFISLAILVFLFQNSGGRIPWLTTLVTLELLDIFTFYRILIIELAAVLIPLVVALVLVCKRKFKLAIWFVAASLLIFVVLHLVPIIGLQMAFSDFRIRN